MDDLANEIALASSWFVAKHTTPFVYVRVALSVSRGWSSILGMPVRRCYVSDAKLEKRVEATGVRASEIVAAVLPDPGATMAGDFGEIITYLYQGAREHSPHTSGPKKWRMKQDRTKATPHSDVLHFVLPTWPLPSPNDRLACSEVKTKSTKSKWAPIPAAIRDCEKDRTSRLAKTLTWLRERELSDGVLGDVTVPQLDRFINSPQTGPYEKRFRAVAVICTSLIRGELKTVPAAHSQEFELVVIGVSSLQKTYTDVFNAAHASALAKPITRTAKGHK